MATNTELIRTLEIRTSVLEDRDTRQDRDIQQLSTSVNKLSDPFNSLIARISVLEAQIAESRKAMEEKDRRHWAVYTALGGSFITAIVSIILTLTRK